MQVIVVRVGAGKRDECLGSRGGEGAADSADGESDEEVAASFRAGWATGPPASPARLSGPLRGSENVSRVVVVVTHPPLALESSAMRLT